MPKTELDFLTGEQLYDLALQQLPPQFFEQKLSRKVDGVIFAIASVIYVLLDLKFGPQVATINAVAYILASVLDAVTTENVIHQLRLLKKVGIDLPHLKESSPLLPENPVGDDIYNSHFMRLSAVIMALGMVIPPLGGLVITQRVLDSLNNYQIGKRLELIWQEIGEE